ncbi:MAG: hypothetical protein K0S08_1320 [Gammaproteobacteria bacterium]|nr:hypothetical protein [Gammaproteobacteria bacterium]
MSHKTRALGALALIFATTSIITTGCAVASTASDTPIIPAYILAATAVGLGIISSAFGIGWLRSSEEEYQPIAPDAPVHRCCL